MTTKLMFGQRVRGASARAFAWSLVAAAVASRTVITWWSRVAASVRARPRTDFTWSRLAASVRVGPRAVVTWWSRLVARLTTTARTVIASIRLLVAERELLVDRARALQQRMAPFVAQWIAPAIALGLLVLSMGGTWRIAGASPPTAAAAAQEASEQQPPVVKKPAAALTGKVNLNTATEEQLMLLPTVGPAKAERIVTWRKKNGGFKRIADLRRVKGFGYKTFKRLEPYLDIKGDTTLQ
jgi:competence ComEA-like helix-hairpin-helix protein